jgi:S-adenosylmethionine:tRNA ribosyltransferase-isomerase
MTAALRLVPDVHVPSSPTIPAAAGPAPRRGFERLLVVHADLGRFRHARVGDLPDVLRAGDLVVLNDAATLPASIGARTPEGHPIEVRLAARLGPGRHRVALFGAGDWRTPTEDRPAPQAVRVGDVLTASPRLHMQVTAHEPGSRLAEIAFVERGPRLLAELYRVGRPIQYSYLDSEVPLRAFQTSYGSRPWASEMPSAGRPLSWEVLLRLRREGVELAVLTHAAGLSSIDGGEVDAALPLPERYEIPAATVEAIERTQARGGRVIAVGTTVVRALEGNVRTHGRLVAGTFVTDLVLDPDARLEIVDGLLSTMHEPGESHFELLSAFADGELLIRANASAARHGYRAHEFGDAILILP